MITDFKFSRKLLYKHFKALKWRKILFARETYLG